MKQPQLLFAACLTLIVAGTASRDTVAAERAASTQDLVQVRASDQVMAAHWTRRADSYVLQVVLDRSKYMGKKRNASADLTAAVSAPQPVSIDGTTPDQNREAFFSANAVRNLRGMDPWITCGSTLTLMEPRQVSGQKPAPSPSDPSLSYMNQPYPPQFKERRVDVWLLKADGTQIVPATYSCDAGPVFTAKPPTHAVAISYEFPIAGSEQAVAAAIRIDDNYYIEKLQRLTASQQ